MSHPLLEDDGMTRNEFLLRLTLGGAVGGYSLPGRSGAVAPGPAGYPLGSGKAPSDLEPADRTDWLERWGRRPLFPIPEWAAATAAGTVASRIEPAIFHGDRIDFVYYGGSEPARARTATPMLLHLRPGFNDLEEWLCESFDEADIDSDIDGKVIADDLDHPDPWETLTRYLLTRCPLYLLAWCHRRNARRCFRVSRMGEVAIER